MSMKLVHLWREAMAVRAKRRAIPDELYTDEVSTALCVEECDIYRDMLDEPASDLAGILQKLRGWSTFFDSLEEGDLPFRLVASALDDAERLAGEEG